MPGSIGITVQGQYVVRPGVYSTIDASAMVPVRPGQGGIVGFVGPADGGAPGTVYEFNSYTDAAKVIRNGPSLAYLARIFAPSGFSNGASKVRFVRLGAPTQATLTASGITFLSDDYGRHTNNLSVTIAAGAGTTMDVTVGKANDNYTRTYNCGLAVTVSSTATAPKLVFDHAAKQVKMYEGTIPAIVATLDYPTGTETLANLASWVAGRAGWTCTITGNPSMPIAYMDNPVLASAPAIVPGGTPLPASQGSLIWQINTDPLCPISAGTLATYTTLTAVVQTLFTGGTGTAFDVFTSSDYTTGLIPLESVTVDHLFLADGTLTVQSIGLAHCVKMWNVTRKRWRILYTGGAPNETSTTALANAKSLDGPVCYVWNGSGYVNPSTGLVENLGGLGAAAQVCGMAAGTWESDSLTNKTITAVSLENPNVQDSVIDQLLIGGVTPIAYDPASGAPTIIQAITTYQKDANVSYRKLQGLRIQVGLHKLCQAVLSQFVGAPQDLATGQAIANNVAKALDLRTMSPERPGGLLTQGFSGGKVTPSWSNLRVVGDGLDSWSIFFEAHPVGETAYIPVQIKLTPVLISL